MFLTFYGSKHAPSAVCSRRGLLDSLRVIFLWREKMTYRQALKRALSEQPNVVTSGQNNNSNKEVGTASFFEVVSQMFHHVILSCKPELEVKLKNLLQTCRFSFKIFLQPHYMNPYECSLKKIKYP